MGLLSIFKPVKSSFRLYCRKDGKWELVDELEEKISWVQARDAYDLESECDAAQLREYIIMEDNEKFKKTHWTKNIRKNRPGLEEFAQASIFTISQIMEVCETLKRFVGGRSEDEVMKFIEMMLMMKNPQMLNIMKNMNQNVVAHPTHVDKEALEALEREAEEFASVQPNPECLEAMMKGEPAKCTQDAPH